MLQIRQVAMGICDIAWETDSGTEIEWCEEASMEVIWNNNWKEQKAEW